MFLKKPLNHKWPDGDNIFLLILQQSGFYKVFTLTHFDALKVSRGFSVARRLRSVWCKIPGSSLEGDLCCIYFLLWCDLITAQDTPQKIHLKKG